MDQTIIIQEGILLILVVINVMMDIKINDDTKTENNMTLMVIFGGIFSMGATFLAHRYYGTVISWIVTISSGLLLLLTSGFTEMLAGLFSTSKS